MNPEYQSTINDLLSLNVSSYCELGPGEGSVAIGLKKAGKNVVCLEAPWDFDKRTSWGKENNIKIYKGEFFSTDFSKIIEEEIECFSLIHAIAHLRFPPHLILEKAFKKLKPGGYFYLSTVNAGSLDKVIKLAKGQAITDEVKKFVEMGEDYKKYCNPSGKYMIWDSWMHVKEYRAFELKKIFEEENFKVIKLFHRNNFKNWENDIICKIWPHLSEEIIIVGKKND